MIRAVSVCLLAALAGLAATPAASPPRAATAPASEPATRPVPLLTPEEEAATFNLPPGFRAEVVAAEPMVEHPVHIAFDPDGRLWVAEMRAYMPDTEGWGEDKPIGRVSVLEDVDGDGRMDKSTVFADELVLPRAVGFAGDGVLIASPPHLFYCRDTDGDGRADTRETLLDDAGTIGNPENSFNGLLYGLDNWIYNANYENRIRHLGNGKFEYSPVPDLGQFGIGRDDYGRLFFNTNSDHLRGALVPPHYMTRNAHSPAALANTRIATDQAVFPAHAATINRGYRPSFVHPDGRLKEFTAACSPWIYRGDLFPPEFYGNAFVAEATSNLVRRAIVSEEGASLRARNAYADREFIASTYERFRPVNFATGPEGALYVVDMHHGLIQHKMSITEYARENYKAKRLNKHLRTGRIFRVVPDGKPAPRVKPNLSKATSAQLVEHLTHPNGWWRDTAQRLLVERQDLAVVPALKRLASEGKSPVHRLHALWTLEGIQPREEVYRDSLADPDAKVRANAIRLAEFFLDPNLQAPMLDAVLKLQNDPSPDVRLQFVLTMSDLATDAGDTAVAAVLRDHGGDSMLREAAVSGMAGRELDFIERLLNDPTWTASDARHDVICDVARAVTRRYDGKEMLRLAELIGAQPPERQWQQVAMLEAIPAVKKDAFGSAKPIEVAEKPAAVDALAGSKHKTLASGSAKLAALFHWPGKPVPPRPKPAPLTPRQRELFAIGRQQYALVCAQCHQPDGMGAPGKAPRLRNSPWALGPDKRLIRIVLHGMRGPVTVDDTVWNMDMPSWAALTDEQIAGVLTYVRRAWGHEAPAVSEADVQAIRDWNQARKDGWTEAELLQIP